MNYYKVVPASSSYRGDSWLTYCYADNLQIGQVVQVEIRNKNILGFIIEKTLKPDFKTKPLSGYKNIILSSSSLKMFSLINNFYPHYLGAVGQLIVPAYLAKYTTETVEEPAQAKILKKPCLT